MNMRTILNILLLLSAVSSVAQNTTVSGHITDSQTGESLIGVSVACIAESKGTITDAFGFFSIDVPIGCTLTCSYIGYENANITILRTVSMPLSILLTEKKMSITEVVVYGSQTTSTLEKWGTGITKIDLKQANTLPVLGGERDVIKILQLMPGIKKEHDGSTGMLVRGGAGDQNLVLLDDAPVYNASHLVGIFSVFNNDAMKDVTMQKGGFTANYGGRLSSVLDIRTKDGNMQKHMVSGGVGLLSARASVEGPILKNRASYIVSARRTYIDQVYKAVGSELPFYFYDLNAKLSFKPTISDQFFFSGYLGKDVLQYGNEKPDRIYQTDFANKLRNRTATLRWNHHYAGQKLFQHSSIIYTEYAFNLNNRINQYEWKTTSTVQDYIAKLHYDYYINNQNHLQFGSEFTHHVFNPNQSTGSPEFSELISNTTSNHISLNEFALFIQNNYQPTANLFIQYGLRLSGADVTQKTYTNLEPRAQIGYAMTSKQSIKFAYSRMAQYMHLVTGASTLPSDVWYPVTNEIKPKQADQLTAGYTLQLPLNCQLQLESYYKWLNNVSEFKEGTIGFSQTDFANDIAQGQAKAYGIELLLQRKSGKWNGWFGYTLAYSKSQFNEINNGEWFYARFDRRHDISIVGNYELTKRITLSAVFAYASGSRFTPIIGQYLVPNGSYTDAIPLPIYGKRNSIILSPSHRLDLSITIKGKQREQFSGEWQIGVYNIYNRTQPYRIRMDVQSDGSIAYKQVGLFGCIPSISYHFNF
jgi:hypothetical protein